MTSPTPGSERLFTPAFLILISGQLLQALGYSSMLLLPLYLEHLGATRAQIGWLQQSLPALAGLACRPFVAVALDRWGRRPTLIVGTVCLVAGMESMVFVDTLGPALWVSRFLYGVGAGALFSSYFAFASDLIPTHRRTEGLALFGIAGLLPMVVNPLVQNLGLDPPELRLYFPLLGFVILASLIPVFFLREPLAQGGPGVVRPSVFKALAVRQLVPVWLASVVFSSLVAVFMTFATVSADARGIENSAAVWLTYAGGAITVRLLGSRIPDRIGPHNLVAPALGCYCVGFVIATQAFTTTGFLLAGLFAGVGHGYCFPVLTSQVVTRVDPLWRGSALTLFTALWSLSELCLTPLCGRLADAFGDASLFAGVATVGAGSLVLWAVAEQAWGGFAGEAG
ncbi:MAG: MFS transporter [Planctomycetes bacterium]|nr:MFS transporter [Planctomycetota bacterium]